MQAAHAPLVLASRSPRRADLLRAAGLPFEVGPAPDVDETPPPGLGPAEVAVALAERKAAAVRARVAPGRVVLGADTVVVLDGALLGKPADAEDAVRLLARLGGREHEVFTGVALAGPAGLVSGGARARVRVEALSEAERRRYVATGEPLDKAGGYAIQGRAASFVRLVEGDLDTVIGLPLALVRSLLEALGRPAGRG